MPPETAARLMKAWALSRELHGPESDTALAASADRVRLLRQLGRSGEFLQAFII